MKLIETLEDLARAGVRVSLHEGKLRVSAPEGVLTSHMRETISTHRTEIVRFLEERREDEARRSIRIQQVDRREPIPASFAQQRLWLIEQLGSELPIYNMYFVLTLTGSLDVEALQAAVTALTERHEILRSALVERDEGVWQVVDGECAPLFRVHEPALGDFDELLYDIVTTRFDLSAPPLIRFDLIRTDVDEWVFAVVQHHVISDGWSANMIKKELSELYAARVESRPHRLRGVEVHYADYAVWERQWAGGELAERQRAYWRDQLSGLPPMLQLDPTRPREAVQRYRGDALIFRFDNDFLRQARGLSVLCGTTLYGTLVSVYMLLLARLTRTDDVAIGSPLASRPYPVLESTLGLFFNAITVRMRIDDQLTVREFLHGARRTVFEAFAHQDLPFDQVVQAVAPERSSSHSPLFQAMFILQSYPEGVLEFPGVRAESTGAPMYSAQYDLMFKLREDDAGMQGLLVFNEELLARADADRVVGWYRRLLAVMAENPDTRLGDLPLPDGVSHDLITEWNASTTREIPARPVHRTIFERLAERPDTTAITFRGEHMSRGELAATAKAVATSLRAAGLHAGDRVAVLAPRSADMVAVLLGIMDAGLTYVPVDPEAPEERSIRMLTAASCTALVVDAPYEGRLREFAGQRLHLPDLKAGVPGEEAPAADVAYVIFTSGSTGFPKGVTVTHANLANLFLAFDEAVPLPDEPVWLAVTNITFDISVLELLWTLSRGVPVVLAENHESLRTGDAVEPNSVPELMAAHDVSALQATPTFLRTLLRMDEGEACLRALRLLLVGGEPMDLALARKLKAIGIPTVLNMYGPTETTVWSTAWELPVDVREVLVGKPLANTTAHVVDAALRPVPVGMFGELVLGGAGVSQGYAAAPEQTAERFVSTPDLDGGRVVYRTGDLARWLPSGELQLAGRTDNQVKVNGYRIELEEIERALRTLDEVVAAVASVQRDEDGTATLVAHYVLVNGGEIEPAELRAALAELLPRQMIPHTFASLAALPTLPSGKVDRRSLPLVAVGPAPVSAAVLPEGALESALLRLWHQVLGTESIGVTDDFFQSGGNSLLVARLLGDIRAEVTERARIVDLFRYPTVQAYAAYLRSARTDEEETAARTVREARLRRRQQILRKQRARG